jgi:fucose 4-O-acetylase-like acetyltransferase
VTDAIYLNHIPLFFFLAGVVSGWAAATYVLWRAARLLIHYAAFLLSSSCQLLIALTGGVTLPDLLALERERLPNISTGQGPFW